ncbi:MAG: hypothetical protein KGL48_15895 [Sphingomonadales bacterium]|nr:hypothetical protein [Sphingomonadales bacterium]MDE2569083.1 hypothetical protein [Sphingomonadales bacterium]
MAELATCIITHSAEGMGARGVRCDNDENVYFPLSIADAAGLEEFEQVDAILVRNDRADPPWKAIKVRRSDGGE